MNQASTYPPNTAQNLRPLNTLKQLTGSQAEGCLQVSSGSVSWWIYLEKGKLTYATHSIEPLERLELHLRRLGYQPTGVSETSSEFSPEANAQSIPESAKQTLRWLVKQQYLQPSQATALATKLAQGQSQLLPNSDYQAICWLVSQDCLNLQQAKELTENLVQEFMESFLLLEEGSHNFVSQNNQLPNFCQLELQPLITYSLQRLQRWIALSSQVSSPYQRPYIFNAHNQQIPAEVKQKLSAILKGFSFRRLAVMLKQDELKLVQTLQPYIEKKAVVLREPQSPFDQLPRISARSTELIQQLELQTGKTTTTKNSAQRSGKDSTATTNQAQHTIVCVDDSRTMLNEITRLLDDKSFTVHPINDPVKALMQIVRIKPDLILLDVGMPRVDGYELCRLLRNHALFKTTPIVMVTGHTGIIDRARAKLVGASAYLTKPFTKSDLLNTVFKHLD